MDMDGVDDLEKEAAEKRARRGSRRKEITPPPRHPKTAADDPAPASAGTGTGEDRQSGGPASGDTGVPVHAPTGAPSAGAAAPAPEPPARTRPPSVEAYLTEDLMEWVWQVRAAGMADRRENVTSAVVRLALGRLREQMTPEQIIAALDQAPSPGRAERRGRAR